MSVIKHTPGPWTVDSPAYDASFEIFANNKSIAIVYASDGSDEPTIFPAEANAHLFAAAPDLLEACELLEAAELGRQDCEECDGGEGEPEACGTCFPKFDDARIKRRLAIAHAKRII